MNSILIAILVIIGIMICCAYPYLFEAKYVEMYGGKGLSYLFAGMLGASGFWLSLELKTPNSWKYSVAIILVVIFLTCNLYWIFRELRQSEATISYKIQFVISQLLFSVGVFGVLFIILGAFYIAGGGGMRKRKKQGKSR